MPGHEKRRLKPLLIGSRVLRRGWKPRPFKSVII
jgi:hypothetical protein